MERIDEILSITWIRCVVVFMAFNILLQDWLGIADAFGAASLITFFFLLVRNHPARYILIVAMLLLFVFK